MRRRGVAGSCWRRLQREEAWKQQDRLCKYCRTPLRRFEVTSDHYRPKSRGGGEYKNIVAACHVCNLAKGNMNPGMFWKMMRGSIPAPFDIQIQAAIRRINLRAEKACKRIRALCPQMERKIS